MYLLFKKLFKIYRSVVAALASLNEMRAFLDISWSHYWKYWSLVAWPQGSPDIMPPKFFFVGIMKNIVCQEIEQNAVDIEMHYKWKGRSIKVIPQQAWAGPRGSGSVKAPDFHAVQRYKGGRLSAIRTGRLYPRRNPWYSFLGAESTPGYMVPSGGSTEKIPGDTTRNRSRDRPTSIAVP
jgi:hypothetical protein